MSEAKFTPGPWHWDSDPLKNDLLERVRYRVVTTGKTITQCYYSSSDEQAEWDARLIAAAPELYEVLQAICEELEADDECSAKQIARHAGRAALSKALGDSK